MEYLGWALETIRTCLEHTPPLHTYWCLLVNGLDHKLFVIEGNVSNFTPRKSNLWGKPESERFTSQLNSNRHSKIHTLPCI